MKLPAIFAGRRRWWLARLVGNGCAQALAAVLLSAWVARAVDLLGKETGAPARALAARQLLFASSMVLVTAALRWLERADVERLSQHYVYRLRQRILRVLWGNGQSALDRGGSGVLLLRFVGDMSAISQWVGRGIARLITAAVLFIGVLAGLALRDGHLALLAGALLSGFGLLALLLGPAVKRAVRRLRRRRAKLATEIVTQVACLQQISVPDSAEDTIAAAQSAWAHQAVRTATRASRRVRDAAIRVGFRAGLFEGLTELLVLGAPLAALWLLAGRGLSLGNLVGVMTLFGLLAAPLRELSRVFEYAQRADVARAKIARFLDQPNALPRRRPGRRHPSAA